MHSTVNEMDDRVPAQSPLRILVVEDTSFVREAIVETLVRSGHMVCEAEDGQRAVACFAESAIDLILLDIVLPDTDGFTLCAQIRAQSNVPIVLLTALNHIDDILHGFEVGADDYITKPFVACELLRNATCVKLSINHGN
ncbi:MAG: response regulator [Litorilinea sp.]